MCVMFKCPNCGLIFEWSIIRTYVRNNYDHMIEIGTLDPSAVIGKTGRVKFHPRYYHPFCPSCGTRSNWIFYKSK